MANVEETARIPFSNPIATASVMLVLFAAGMLWMAGVVARAQDDPYNFTDVSASPTVFETTELPTDENGELLTRYLASVGNGHVSTTVYTDTVYMNGLYNGERGDSHRARIPSRNNVWIAVNASVVVANHTYALDVSRGAFLERFSTPEYDVEVRTYAHRYFNRVIVTQIRVDAKTDETPALDLWLTSTPGAPSDDVNFDAEAPYAGLVPSVYQCGAVFQVEDAEYQPVPPSVCIVATVVDPKVEFVGNGSRTYFASYDSDLDGAASDFDAVSEWVTEGRDEDLYQNHVDAWAAIWDEGRVQVEGNLDLAKLFYGCLYYILSSAPVATPTHGPSEPFYGLSPGGLAYGALSSDYQGHSFWDTETWMYPTVLYLFPEVARRVLDYRRTVLEAARNHANETGYQGARFPWESAATGREVTPDCCPETSTYQIHVTGDVGYATRQYVAATRDFRWLRDSSAEGNGCALLRDVAEFWASRATFNATTRLYDIRGVMGPDEDHYDVDNNDYTNVQAGYSIFFAKYAECLCNGSMEKVPDEWVDLASSLTLVYDEVVDYHPEYEGYPLGQSIKQADAVLLGFPLLYSMNVSTRRNDLLVYANVTRDDGPAMTWAMHTVGFLELDDLDNAEFYFNRSYQWYRREPFKIWTESKPPTLGAVNFLTGMGGFLQSVVSGYAGLRVYPEKIVFFKPRLPPHSTGLALIGLDYLENTFDVNVTATNVTLRLTVASEQYPLVVESDGVVAPFEGTIRFDIGDDNVVLTLWTTTATSCPLPLDVIGIPLASTTP